MEQKYLNELKETLDSLESLRFKHVRKNLKQEELMEHFNKMEQLARNYAETQIRLDNLLNPEEN